MPGFPVPFRGGSEGMDESPPARRRLPNPKNTTFADRAGRTGQTGRQ
jgi:hypothetical protein